MSKINQSPYDNPKKFQKYPKEKELFWLSIKNKRLMNDLYDKYGETFNTNLTKYLVTYRKIIQKE